MVWGALHGIYLVLGLWARDVRQTMIRALGLDGAPWLLKYLQIILTFALVSFTWIFFRANNTTVPFLQIGCSATLSEWPACGAGASNFSAA